MEIDSSKIKVGFLYKDWTIYKIEEKKGLYGQMAHYLYFRNIKTDERLAFPVSETMMNNDNLEPFIKSTLDGRTMIEENIK